MNVCNNEQPSGIYKDTAKKGIYKDYRAPPQCSSTGRHQSRKHTGHLGSTSTPRHSFMHNEEYENFIKYNLHFIILNAISGYKGWVSDGKDKGNYMKEADIFNHVCWKLSNIFNEVRKQYLNVCLHYLPFITFDSEQVEARSTPSSIIEVTSKIQIIWCDVL
jgi:hypothetical protein